MNDYTIFKPHSTSVSQKRLGIFTALCLLTYFFNCTDFLFTYTFLKTGYFYEINPLMRPIVTYPIISIIIKIIFPAFLLIPILKRLSNTESKRLKIGIFFAGLVTLFYFSLNCMHLYYLNTYILSI